MCLAKNRITKYRVDKRRMEGQKQIGEQKTLVGLFLLFIPAKIDGYLNEQRLERNHRIEDRKISTFID